MAWQVPGCMVEAQTGTCYMTYTRQSWQRSMSTKLDRKMPPWKLSRWCTKALLSYTWCFVIACSISFTYFFFPSPCVSSAALLWLSICTSLDIKANTYGLGTCWLLNFFCFHPAWHCLWNSVIDETFCTNLLKIKNLIIEWFGWFELERNMKIILFQPPCSRQGHLPDEVAQSSILEHFQGWYSHNVS